MTAFAVSAKAGTTASESDVRISGPHVHENLAVYFIHGKSLPGEVPLTLEEAIKLARVRVVETGEVNELKIENLGNEPVFIQSGDIVKGGKQDRVITSSFILKPKSGAIPLSAFCVEQGRWSKRGAESAAMFASSAEAMPSRKAKLSMRAADMEASSSRGGGDRQASHTRQAEVWREVEDMQMKLSSGISSDVASGQSASSLQLSLENEKLQEQRAAYIKALEDAGAGGSDIVGYAFAVNGRMNSADVYASNGLFRKMWPKQLQAAATEALGEKSGQSDPAPGTQAVKAFLDSAKAAAVQAKAERSGNRIEIRDSATAVYSAAAPATGPLVHENYLAK